MKWCSECWGAAVPQRLQAAWEASEPGKPKVKAETAGSHFFSCSSLEPQDTNGGLENPNKFTTHIYVYTPAVLICSLAQLLCHILDLDLIWSSLWLNRKLSCEPNNFLTPHTPPVTASLLLILLNFYMNTCPLGIRWCLSRQFTFILKCLAIRLWKL